MKTLKELLKEINDWQDSVFTKATVWSAMEHLDREVKELRQSIYSNPTRESQEGELADVFLLLAGVAHLLELDLEKAVEEKMTINRRRVWGHPDKDGVVEHIKEITYETPIEIDYSPEMDTIKKIIFIREED